MYAHNERLNEVVGVWYCKLPVLCAVTTGGENRGDREVNMIAVFIHAYYAEAIDVFRLSIDSKTKRIGHTLTEFPLL